MRTFIRPVLFCALCALSAPSFSMGLGNAKDMTDPELKKAQEFIDKKNYTEAAATLKAALAKGPVSADRHTLYAFSLRQGPKPDMSAVFMHYNEALKLDPKSLNAHEYLGEAYLMSGNTAKAQEILETLGKLCPKGCMEKDTLEKSIAKSIAKAK